MYEEWDNESFLDEAEADLQDLLEARIKDVEHLAELKKLLLKIDMMSQNAETLSRTTDEVLYGFANSKTIEDFQKIHARRDEYNKWFEETFSVFLNSKED